MSTGTFSYSGNPSSSSLDAVRFLVRDTEETGYEVSDEEIAWTLTENSDNPYAAAATVATTLGLGYASMASKTVGDLSLQYGDRSKNWMDAAKSLAALAARHGFTPTPYAGGISVADKQVDLDDDDVANPFFYRRQLDNPTNDDDRLIRSINTDD